MHDGQVRLVDQKVMGEIRFIDIVDRRGFVESLVHGMSNLFPKDKH